MTLWSWIKSNWFKLGILTVALVFVVGYFILVDRQLQRGKILEAEKHILGEDLQEEEREAAAHREVLRKQAREECIAEKERENSEMFQSVLAQLQEDEERTGVRITGKEKLFAGFEIQRERSREDCFRLNP